MQKWALVTGATVGIGESFTRVLAEAGYNLILNARTEETLNQRATELRSKFNIEVKVVAADVSTQCEVIEKVLRDNQIDVLVNNAGFGLNQSFSRSNIEDEEKVLDVLVRAPMRLAHAVIPQMKARKSGIIINVSSVAGFIAGGHYSAAKAFVTVLSESLATELKPHGVSVMALCPGFTHTEFHQRAGMKMGGLPSFMWLDSDFLVRAAWRDVNRGVVVSTPGWQYKFLLFVMKILPRKIVRSVSISLRSRQR